MNGRAAKFRSRSEAETKKIGMKIGKRLRAGDILALVGDLGSGKTTLVKGIAKGLSVPDEREVTSPSFTLIREYQGRETIYHIDWYRLKSVAGADERLAFECFNRPVVTVVEWADRGRRVLPTQHIRIHLKHAGVSKRLIEISVKGKKYEGWLNEIARV